MEERGFTLIEVLIALIILAIGFLGIAALQINAIKNNQSSLQRTQASVLAYFMMDQMRANKAKATTGSYNTSGMLCNIPSSNTTLAQNDTAVWITALKNNISNTANTCGEIDCGEDNCSVRVQWDDSRAEDGGTTQTVEVQSIL